MASAEREPAKLKELPNFGSASEADIREGIARLGKVLRKFV